MSGSREDLVFVKKLVSRKSMLGVEEPPHLRRASLVSEIYSEANDPLTAELTARGRQRKKSSTGIADFGKKLIYRDFNTIKRNLLYYQKAGSNLIE